MNIVTVRRISQAFFLLLFLWLAVVASVGTEWWQMRGWPIDWLLQLDPLVALGTLLTTHTLYAGLAWAGATLMLTIVLGRFFCGWVCPFGTMHQIVGFLGGRGRPVSQRIAANDYRRGAAMKYYILAAMLVAAIAAPGSLLTGFLDPIPLAYRSVNLVLLPLADAKPQVLSATQRYYEWGWLIGTVFLAALALNLWIPRFYCRFVCPLGALLGICGRFAIWRIGKSQGECSDCKLCQGHCEGACEPAGRIRSSECLLCMNCLNACRDNLMQYRPLKSEAGETTSPDTSRRGLIVSLASGLAAVPLMRLGGKCGSNWNSSLIRPRGRWRKRSSCNGVSAAASVCESARQTCFSPADRETGWRRFGPRR